MVHGFANIMKKTALFCLLHICADLRREDACQLRNFDGMGKLVLPVGGSEFEAAHHTHNFRMEACDIGIVSSLLAGFVNDLFDRPGLILNDFFNVSRMDPAV